LELLCGKHHELMGFGIRGSERERESEQVIGDVACHIHYVAGGGDTAHGGIYNLISTYTPQQPCRRL